MLEAQRDLEAVEAEFIRYAEAENTNVVDTVVRTTTPFSISVVANVYNPLGFLSPYILTGKRVLQEMCKRDIGWNKPLPSELRPRWEVWLHDLKNLKNLKIPLCFIPQNIDSIKKNRAKSFL